MDQLLYLRLGLVEDKLGPMQARFLRALLKYLESAGHRKTLGALRFSLGVKNLVSDVVDMGVLKVGRSQGLFIPASFATVHAAALKSLLNSDRLKGFEFEHIGLLRRLSALLDSASKNVGATNYPEWAELPEDSASRDAAEAAAWLRDKPQAPHINPWRDALKRDLLSRER